MAANLRVRLERLEQQRGGAEPLIVQITRFDDEHHSAGVSVNGIVTQCQPGQTAAELEEQLIRGIEAQRRPGIFVVHQV
ncbi:hypothetical protein [Cupriavidus metallidurans]|uniref:hypothetical protein n=1 Tax=Cupriavidus metallidurans TaxID=119219 RepID=UPI00056489FC|nr:hypothetical protein [Cupriavidus metallidurans]